MKVKDFIDELQKKYNPDDELYFTTAALDSEFVFDKATVYAKDGDEDTDVFLEFEGQHKKEFLDAVFEDQACEMRDELMPIIDKYLPDNRCF